MKIQILSDLHLEFSEHKFDVKNTDSDILVLAGDIGVGNSALPFIDKLLQEHQICVPRTQGVYLIEFVFSYYISKWLPRLDSNQHSHRQ